MPEGAVYVGRPTIWGNPWTHEATLATGLFRPEHVAEANVDEYQGWLKATPEQVRSYQVYQENEKQRQELLARIGELKGKDLACWCPLDQPCHADVLLRLANPEEYP